MIKTYSITIVNQGNDPIRLAPLDFAGGTAEALKFDDLSKLDDSEPAIVYIVSHAVPNALRVGDQLVPEADLVKQLAKQRKKRTLVILDTCFAESFAELSGLEWPSHFGRIFSCRQFERSWHSGGEKRVSLFSSALNTALKACMDNRCSAPLKSSLEASLGGLQTPVIDDSAYEFLNTELGLPRTKQANQRISELAIS